MQLELSDHGAAGLYRACQHFVMKGMDLDRAQHEALLPLAYVWGYAGYELRAAACREEWRNMVDGFAKRDA